LSKYIPQKGSISCVHVTVLRLIELFIDVDNFYSADQISYD